jgi:regulatory protein
MSVISAVKPQKFKKRVNIYLDGKFAFGLDLESFVRFGLKVGGELSEERVTEITKKAEFQKTLDRLLMFATLRPRSEKEINDWMIRKKVNENIKESLVDRIRNLELLDDRKFARWWVDQRVTFKSKSLRDLDYELRNKGITKDIITEILAETEVDELGSAKKLIEKNNYKWSRFSGSIARQKMRIFLARKGFTWDVIKRATE